MTNITILHASTWEQYINCFLRWSVLPLTDSAPVFPVFSDQETAVLADHFPACHVQPVPQGIGFMPLRDDHFHISSDSEESLGEIAWLGYVAALTPVQQHLRSTSSTAHGSDSSALVEQYHTLRKALSSPSSSLVVGFWNDKAVITSASYAIATRTPLLIFADPAVCSSVLEQVPTQDVIVFCDVPQLHHAWFAGWPIHNSHQFGLVPSIDPASASITAAKLLIARATEHTPATSVFINFLDTIPSREVPGLSIIGRDRGHLDVLHGLLAERSNHLNMVIIAAHGYEDRLFVGEHMIKSHYPDPICGPAEAQDGEQRLTIQDIRADILFVNTCLGAQVTAGPIPFEQRLSRYALAHTPYAYVSTAQVKDNSTVECCFFYNLVHAGHALGEAVQMINTWMETAEIDIGCYLLLGDPAIRPFPYDPYLPVHDVTEPSTEIMVEAHGRSWVTVELSGLPNASLPYIYAEGDSSYARNFYAVLPLKKGRHRLYIFSWDRGEATSMRLTVTTQKPLNTVLQYIYQHITLLVQRLKECGIQSSIIKGVLTQIDNEMNALSRIVPRCRYELDAYELVQAKAHNLIQYIATIQNKLINILVTRMLDRPLAFNETYRKSFVLTLVRRASLRCSCGQDISEKHLSYSLHPGHNRVILLCPACGVVCDSPGATPLVLVRGKGIAYRGEEVVLDLTFDSAARVEQILCWSVCIEGMQQHAGAWKIEPGTGYARFYIQWHESLRVQVPANITPQRYVLKGFAMINLELIYFCHTLQVIADP